jgi:hypothetical protein
MNRRSTASVLRDSTFYIAIFGYLSELALLYLSFSQIPEEFLHASHKTATLWVNIFVLPPFAALLFGSFYLSERGGVQALIRCYSPWLLVPGIIFSALSIEAGHAFIGAMFLAFLFQWVVLIIGIVHVGITLRRLT